MQDGLAAVFQIARALKQGRLSDLLAGLPETHMETREVACRTQDKGRILHTLCDHTAYPHTLGEGVRFEHENGFATVVPDSHRGLVRVVSESVSSEFAQELCEFYFKAIEQMTKAEKNP